MAGVLQFTLGLEASNFLRNIGLASGQILSLASVGQGLQSAMHGMWDAIEKGAALNDLSARTGESVENLFKLRHAFDVAGVGADSVAPMIIKFQKAMSGVTEDGEKTEKLFAAMGLNFNQLKNMEGPERLVAIAKVLNGINSDQAAGIAGKIFGREGAGGILQIARGMDDFVQALKDADPAAKVFGRVAELFDKIDDTISAIKMKVGGMFAGMAEGIQPALQKLLDFVNELDFVGFGKRLGSEIETAINAINLGKFEEYLKLAIAAAVEQGTDLLSDQVKLKLSQGFVAVTTRDLDKLAQDYLAKARSEIGRPEKTALERLREFRESIKPSEGDTGISDFINFLTSIPKMLPKRTVDLPGKDEKADKFNFQPPNVTDIEKIGFVFNNGISRQDHQREIADNTRRTYEAVDKLADRFSGSSANFKNQ